MRWRCIVALTGSYLKASAPRYYCAFKCYVVLEMHGINSGTEREEETLALSEYIYCKMTILKSNINKTQGGEKCDWFQTYSSQTYAIMTQPVFQGRIPLPTLWSIPSGSHPSSSCLHILISPSLSCVASVPCPLGTSQLPVGRAQQPLGI